MAQAIVEATRPLIPLTSRQMDGAASQTVNARELHAFLQVGRDFSNWIKARVLEYGFEENEDFVMSEDLSSPNPASAKSRAQRIIEYHLTLDMAKELAMVERNERGRQARRYFIECEKQLRAQAAIPTDLLGQKEPPVVHDRDRLQPSNVFAYLLNIRPCLSLEEAAQKIKSTRPQLVELLQDHQWLMRKVGHQMELPTDQAVALGYVKPVMMPTNEPILKSGWRVTVGVTPAGMQELAGLHRQRLEFNKGGSDARRALA